MIDTRNTLAARIATAALALTATFAGAAATIAPATAAPITAPLRAETPSAGELTAKLGVAINTSASRAARAAELEAGEAGLGTMDAIAGLLAAAPPSLRYNVVNPSVSGDRIDATLRVTTEGYPDFNYAVSWRQLDGTWKFTREAQCNLASALSLPC
ncbi:hypothetical protein ACQP0C_37430 [Nocardia sp. CA-129566]|uniref:hypothetical protein n=1 Tax=Nocardia sp. CA-129566 TaxID=3239976 RepID=UPI003D988E01